MRIEILLKEIRIEKRLQFVPVIKNNWNIKFTFKLYRKEPSLSMAVRIAQALNVKVDELYKIIP